jgi:hypothetical protein
MEAILYLRSYSFTPPLFCESKRHLKLHSLGGLSFFFNNFLFCARPSGIGQKAYLSGPMRFFNTTFVFAVVQYHEYASTLLLSIFVFAPCLFVFGCTGVLSQLRGPVSETRTNINNFNIKIL